MCVCFAVTALLLFALFYFSFFYFILFCSSVHFCGKTNTFRDNNRDAAAHSEARREKREVPRLPYV